MFIRWAPCSLKYQAVFHPRASLLATPSGLGLLFLWEHWYGPLFHAGLSWNIALFGYFLQKSKKGLPSGVSGKEPACQWRCERHTFSPWVGKIPWRKAWQPTPVVLPGEFHGQRSLVGYSPWGRKELGYSWSSWAHTHSGLSQNWALGMYQQTRRTRSCFHGAYFLMGWEDNLFINEWANTHTHNKENINTRQRIKSGWCANRGLGKPLWKSHTYMGHKKCIHRSKKQVMQRFRVEQPWGTERKLLQQSLVGVEWWKGRACLRERRQEVKAWDFI